MNFIDPEGLLLQYIVPASVVVTVGVTVYVGYQIYLKIEEANTNIDIKNQKVDVLINYSSDSNTDACEVIDEAVDSQMNVINSAGDVLIEGSKLPGTLTGGRP